jgi:hypothetical protein
MSQDKGKYPETYEEWQEKKNRQTIGGLSFPRGVNREEYAKRYKTPEQSEKIRPHKCDDRLEDVIEVCGMSVYTYITTSSGVRGSIFLESTSLYR